MEYIDASLQYIKLLFWGIRSSILHVN